MLTAIIKKLKSIFLENLGLKLFSLLIALLLWLFVMGAEDITTTARVKLVLISPEDKVMVSDVPDKINITVSGPWAAVKGWNADNHVVRLDLTSLELGPTVIYLEESKLNLPSGLTLQRVNPSEFTINFAKKSSKKVKVVPVWRGRPKYGFKVVEASVDPNEITIEGGESDLVIVDEVLTEEVDVEGKASTFAVAVNPLRLSKNISFPDKDPLLMTIKIGKDLIERTFKNIPIKIEKATYESTLKPASLDVTLSGLRKSVDKIKPEEIHLFVDASKEEGEKPQSVQTREIEVRLPSKDLKIKLPSYTVQLETSDKKIEQAGDKAEDKTKDDKKEKKAK